ncbi:MAG TPA: DUF1684 domain-containing protein [Vicinamibacterales bacterium]|jgi:hypothetical protein
MTRALIGLVLGAALVGLCGCASEPTDSPSRYVRQIQADRAAKDAAFRTESHSPIPATKRNVLLPLNYYPPDPSYRVPAVLKPDPQNVVIEVPTSTGKPRREQVYGTLEFLLKGQTVKLTAFVEEGSVNADRLFVPFRDPTNGTETYGGGRYLDLERTPTGLYVIDFNEAYNPYCAYSPTWECPFPPPENRLPVPIKAGEKLPKSEIASHGSR